VTYSNGQSGVLAQEEHGASQELLVVQLASLDLVEGDDDGLEEVDVLFSEGDCETRNDGSENVEEFGGPVELEGLVDERVEAVGDGLSDHLSPGDELGVKSVENVFQIFSFSGFLGVEELEECFDEDVGDVDLEGLDIGSVVDNELQEELVDGLGINRRVTSLPASGAMRDPR
jgi:hypothetical protein